MIKPPEEGITLFVIRVSVLLTLRRYLPNGGILASILYHFWANLSGQWNLSAYLEFVEPLLCSLFSYPLELKLKCSIWKQGLHCMQDLFQTFNYYSLSPDQRSCTPWTVFDKTFAANIFTFTNPARWVHIYAFSFKHQLHFLWNFLTMTS